MKISVLRGGVLCVLGLVGCQTARADLLTNWNVVTTGDLYAGNGVQGAVRVGGSLIVQNNFSAASSLGSPNSSYSSLLVGGNISTNKSNPETVKIGRGDVAIGGTINGATNNNDRVVSAKNGTVKFDSSLSGVGAIDLKELQADSAAFQGMTSTGTIYIPTKQVDTATLTITSVDAAGNAVFNVDGAALLQNSLVRGLALDVNGYKFGTGQSIVINVSGSSLTFQNGFNLSSGFQNLASNIIWNFYDAQQLNLNGDNFAGALLAPTAFLQNSNGLTGSVFAAGMSDVSNVKLPYYQGYDPSTIRPGTTPEPSSLAMAGIALAAAGIVQGKRGRRRSIAGPGGCLPRL